MQHRGQGGADADDADPAGGRDLTLGRQQLFSEMSHNSNGSHNGGADENEAQVVGDILDKFVHFSNTSQKNSP